MNLGIKSGASEIDMVINIDQFKEKKYKLVSDEISLMVKNSDNNIIKVIIEAGILTREEIMLATQLVEDSGAQFIKTSTGFSAFGASTDIIKTIKNSIKLDLKIKASGGIKTYKQIKGLLASGADRIGTSSGIIIMKEIGKK